MKTQTGPQKPSGKRWTSMARRGIVGFGVLAAAILFYFALFRLGDIARFVSGLIQAIQPVIYGVAIAYLLNPIMLVCQRRLDPFLKKHCRSERKALSLSKAFSITVAILVGVSFLVILALLIIPQLSQSIIKLVNDLPGYLDNFMTWVNDTLNSREEWAQTLSKLLTDGVAYLEEWARTSLPQYATNMLSYVTSGVISVVNLVINLFVGLVVAVYSLNEKSKFVGQSKKLLYAFFKPQRANDIIDTARHGHKLFGEYIYGKILDSIIVGVVTFVAMVIMRMPYSLLISVIIGVTNIIPFFGPFIGGIPSALLILLSDPMQGVYFIIFLIVMQQIDGNILGPKILGNTTGISEFWVTFSLLFFGGLFGIMGMIIGVPIFAVIYYLVQTWLRKRMAKRHMPPDSQDYIEAVRMDEDSRELVYPSPKGETEQKAGPS